MISIIARVKPDEIYNLAAQSHVKVSFEMPEYTANVDALGTLRILEAVRSAGLTEKVKFYQASTSELYGKVQEIPQKETTPFYPRSPYGECYLVTWFVHSCQPNLTAVVIALLITISYYSLPLLSLGHIFFRFIVNHYTVLLPSICSCREVVQLLDCGQLSRGIQHVCCERHPLQPREHPTWTNLCHAQD